MKDSTVYDCTIIHLDNHHYAEGNITVVANGITVPFDVRRVYYLYDVPGGETRGGHAHKELYQLMVAASGSFSVTLDDGAVKRTFLLIDHIRDCSLSLEYGVNLMIFHRVRSASCWLRACMKNKITSGITKNI